MIAQEEATTTRHAAAEPAKTAGRRRRTPAPANLVTAVDVGTTKVCTIVGHKEGDRGIRGLAHSTVPCDGLRKGNVSDVAATANAVRESVRQVEATTGYAIESAFIGVTGSHISFVNRRDRLGQGTRSGVITADELARSPMSGPTGRDEPGRKLIHAIRRSYTLDGVDGIRNPVGMHSKRIDVDTHVVTGGSPFIDKLARAVEEAGISITSLVLEPLASGLAVMTPREREHGAVLVDIGGGTTDVVGFSRGRICYTGVIPVGGFQFTNDIAVTFNTSYGAAEDAKLKYGSAEARPPSRRSEIMLPVAGRNADLRLQPGDISQLTRERAKELARLVRMQLDESQIGDKVRSQVVLTGGTSNLPGLVELMRQSLSVPVRQGVPEMRGVFPSVMKDPIYATGIGILLWAINDYSSPAVQVETGNNTSTEAGLAGLLSGLSGRIARLVRGALFVTRKGTS